MINKKRLLGWTMASTPFWIIYLYLAGEVGHLKAIGFFGAILLMIALMFFGVKMAVES